MRQHLARTVFLFLWLTLPVGWAPGVWAQGAGEASKPLNLSGVAGFGFFSTSTRNGFATDSNNALGNLQFNLSGYLHHPKLLTFQIQPTVSGGRQSAETIMNDGTGGRATVTFLGGRPWPLSLSFGTLRHKTVTFGALNRIAGLEADTRENQFSANWHLLMRRLPEIRLNYSRFSTRFDPDAPLTSQVKSRDQSWGLGLKHSLLGWEWSSELRFYQSDTDLANLFAPEQPPYLLRRRGNEFRALGSRSIGRNLRLDLHGGRVASDSTLAGRPFDQTYSYGNATVAFKVNDKFVGNFRAGLSSNLLAQELDQAIGGGAGGGQGGAAPSVLVPVQTRVRWVGLGTQLFYSLTKDLRVDAQVSHDATRQPRLNGGQPGIQQIGASDSTLLNYQAGLGYQHRFRRWQLASRYAANFGRLDFGVAGKSRARGHTFFVTATTGSVRRLEVTGVAYGSFQRTQNSFLVQNRDWSAGLSVARLLARAWTLRASYNLERSRFENAGTQFDATGSQITLAVNHRLLDLNVSQSLRDGVLFQPGLSGGIVPARLGPGLQAGVPAFLQTPSTLNFTTLTATVRPRQRLYARLLWMRNRQTISDRAANRFTRVEFLAGYRFRLLTLETGFTRHAQAFGIEPFSRHQLFVRISREFHVF